MPATINTCIAKFNDYLLDLKHENLEKNQAIAIAMAELTQLKFNNALDASAKQTRIFKILESALQSFTDPYIGTSDGRELLLILMKTEASHDIKTDPVVEEETLYINIINKLSRYIKEPSHTNYEKNKAIVEALRIMTTMKRKDVSYEVLESILRETLLAFYGDTSDSSEGHKLLTGLYKNTVDSMRKSEAKASTANNKLIDLNTIFQIKNLQSIEALDTFFKEKASAIFSTFSEDTDAYLEALLTQAVKLHFNEKNAGSAAGSILSTSSEATRRDTISRFFNITFQGKLIDSMHLISLYRHGTIEQKIKAFELFCDAINSQKDAGVAKLANIIDAILLAYRTEEIKKHQQVFLATARDLNEVTQEANDISLTATEANKTYNSSLSKVDDSKTKLKAIKEQSATLLSQNQIQQETVEQDISVLDTQLTELRTLKQRTETSRQNVMSKQAELNAVVERLYQILITLPADKYEDVMDTIVTQVTKLNRSLLRVLENSTDESSRGLVNLYSNLEKLIGHINQVKQQGLNNVALQDKLSNLTQSLQTSLARAKELAETNAQAVSKAIEQNNSAQEQLARVRTHAQESSKKLKSTQKQCTTIIDNYVDISTAIQEAQVSLNESIVASNNLKDAADQLAKSALSKTMGVIETRYAFIETTETYPSESTLRSLIPDSYDKGYVFTASGIYFINKKYDFVNSLNHKNKLGMIREKLQPTLYAQNLTSEHLEYLVEQTGFLPGGEFILDDSTYLPSDVDRMLHGNIKDADSFDTLKSIINDIENRPIILNERSSTLLALTLSRLIVIDYNNSPDEARLTIYRKYFPKLSVNEDGQMVSLGIKSENDSFFHTLHTFSQLILELNPGFTHGSEASPLVKEISELLKERISIDKAIISAVIEGIRKQEDGLQALNDKNIASANKAADMAKKVQTIIQRNDAPTEDLSQIVDAIAEETTRTLDEVITFSETLQTQSKEIAELQGMATDEQARNEAENQLFEQTLIDINGFYASMTHIAQTQVEAITTQLTQSIRTIESALPGLQASQYSTLESFTAVKTQLQTTLNSMHVLLSDNKIIALLDAGQQQELKQILVAKIRTISQDTSNIVDENASVSALIQQYHGLIMEKMNATEESLTSTKIVVDSMKQNANDVKDNQDEIRGHGDFVVGQTEANQRRAAEINTILERLTSRLNGLQFISKDPWIQEIKVALRDYAILIVRQQLSENHSISSKDFNQRINNALKSVISTFTRPLFEHYKSQIATGEYNEVKTHRKIDKFNAALESTSQDGLLDINKVVDKLAIASQRRRGILTLFGKQSFVTTDSTQWMKGEKEGKSGLLGCVQAATRQLEQAKKSNRADNGNKNRQITTMGLGG